MVEIFHRRERHRDNKPLQTVMVIGTQKASLLVVYLCVIYEKDIVPGQFGIDIMDSLLIVPHVLPVQSGYLLDYLLGLESLLHPGLLPPLDYPVLGSHPHPVELVEIVGIYAEERQPFQQRDIRFASLLQYSPVEIHPAYIAFKIRICSLFSAHIYDNFVQNNKIQIKIILKFRFFQ